MSCWGTESRARPITTVLRCSGNKDVPSAAESGYYLNMSIITERALPPQAEGELIETGLASIRERLPSGWSLDKVMPKSKSSRADATTALRSPLGEEVQVLIEARRLVEARDVSRIAEQLGRMRDDNASSIGLVVSRYLTKSTRDRFAEAGLSYVDATGNLLLRADSPAVFLSDRGADKDPWRGPGRPRGTLKGEPAAKVVRALLDMPGPWKIRDLVSRSEAATGSVYRVVEFLESEALAARDENGLIAIPDWAALLRRWSKDYGFLQTNSVTQWIAPRGLESVLESIRKSSVGDYAVTGSVAAATWAAYAPARSAMIYALNPEQTAEEWGLRATDTGANVLLARPAYGIALERSIDREDGLRIAAPTQVAADLMTGPGRAPAEAEELIEWMGRNEQLWR